MAFYSLDKINSLKCQYNFLLGARSCGKTYAVIRQAIKNFIETGEPFAYIRRYKESIAPSKVSSLCAPHYKMIEELTNGEFNCVKVWQQRFWLELRDDNGELIKKNPQPLGFLISLNTQDVDKGEDKGFVRYIIFDEVIPRNNYLRDEWTIFTNCISSLVRDRKGTTIYLLANPISKFSLYFDELGIDFNGAEQGKIYVIKYDEAGSMKCAFEYIEDNLEGSSSVANEYFAFNNEKARSITHGVWEFDNVQHLESGIYKAAEHKKEVYIEFTGKIFCCEICKYNGTYFLFYRPANKIPENAYYLTLNRKFSKYCIIACNNSHPLVVLINDIFRTGQVYYSDNQTGDYILGFRKAAREIKV